MVDGEPANIAKTYGNRYQILADLYILPISPYSPVVAPGAIQLAKWGALQGVPPPFLPSDASKNPGGTSENGFADQNLGARARARPGPGPIWARAHVGPGPYLDMGDKDPSTYSVG